jgi:hypothetical protein
MDWAEEEARWKAFIEAYEIKVGDTRAIVSLNAFNALGDYSCTIPSGTVIGKVWKRHELYSGRGQWWFGQFSRCEDPEMVNIIWRELHIRQPGTDDTLLATDDNIDAIKVSEALA